MSASLAGLALVAALSQRAVPSALVTHPIVCAPNSDISSSGCGNSGPGQSGINNVGAANSGAANNGTANSGTGNIGSANSGTGNVGVGNSGCGNTGVANSGGGNVGVALSGGNAACNFSTPPTTATTLPHGGTTTTLGTAVPPTTVEVPILPVTGRNSTGPLTLALGLMLSGGAAVTLANRRRHAMAAATGGELMPLSAAVGLLLTGRAKPAEPQDQSPKS